MAFEKKLTQIDELQNKIISFGKLPDEVLKAINYKIRLEWNFNSNIMEGNTLTKQETKSVMVGNITVGGKPLKDILEMKGHDTLITQIMKMGKGDLNISEARIKEIHKGIMYEENPENQIKIGVWKTQNNYLYNYKGERVDFVPLEEVKDRMHKLMNWLNTEKEKLMRNDKDALHPVIIAFKFHLDYITIHPFYDGNGRTARILMNLILVSYGFPPFYIKLEEKGRYYQYLADVQEYGSDPTLFFEFMADTLIRSQQIIINAIEGKSVEDPDDIDKEIAIWMKRLPTDTIKGVQRSDEAVFHVYEDSILPLLHMYIAKHQLFETLFRKMEISGQVNNNCGMGLKFIEDIMQQYDNRKGSILSAYEMSKPGLTEIHLMSLHLSLLGYKMNGINIFDYQTHISFNFDSTKWIINYCNTKKIEKLYDEILSEAEILTIVKEAIRSLQGSIDTRIQKTN